MGIAIDEPVATGIQRGRGGFYRSSTDTPYVTDPSGALVKSGERKGQPKRLPYGSPSSFGEQIANMFSLTKWGERMAALGIALGDDELRAECFNLAYLAADRDSKEFKDAADALIVKAKAAADAHLDADRGTYVHGFILEGRSNVEELIGLGIPEGVQEWLDVAFHQMLDDHGLEVVGTELACVNDDLRLAGTLDAHVRLTSDLRLIAHGGEIVDLPAGTILVLDLKAGRLRTDSQGRIEYWRDYPIQIAAYAGSVPYDTEAETRGEWGYEVNQDWALLAHLNTREAIDGLPARCTLVLVDIAAGRQAAELVVAAKVWERRTDVMTIQPQSDAAVTRDLEASVAQVASRGVVSPDAEAAAGGTARPPAASLAAPEVLPLTSEQPAAAGATPCAPAAANPPTRAEVVAQLGGPMHVPDEGAEVDKADFEPLEATYLLLGGPERVWFERIIKEGAQASLDFRAHHTKTVRRFEIYRGLLHLAERGECDDEVVRGLVGLVLDSDAPLFPVITCGHAVGALSAAEAATFALLVDEHIVGRLAATVLPDGRTRFHRAA